MLLAQCLLLACAAPSHAFHSPGSFDRPRITASKAFLDAAEAAGQRVVGAISTSWPLLGPRAPSGMQAPFDLNRFQPTATYDDDEMRRLIKRAVQQSQTTPPIEDGLAGLGSTKFREDDDLSIFHSAADRAALSPRRRIYAATGAVDFIKNIGKELSKAGASNQREMASEDFVRLRPGVQCCHKGAGATITQAGSTAGCEKACLGDDNCLFFRHSVPAQKCSVCSTCDDFAKSSDDTVTFTAWQRRNVGSLAPITTDGYQAVIKLDAFADMEWFVKRVITAGGGQINNTIGFTAFVLDQLPAHPERLGSVGLGSLVHSLKHARWVSGFSAQIAMSAEALRIKNIVESGSRNVSMSSSNTSNGTTIGVSTAGKISGGGKNNKSSGGTVGTNSADNEDLSAEVAHPNVHGDAKTLTAPRALRNSDGTLEYIDVDGQQTILNQTQLITGLGPIDLEHSIMICCPPPELPRA